MTDAASHYDSLSVQTKRERARGPAAALKRVHNAFKEDLLADFAPCAGFLVDVGCGRGGDIWKWSRIGVRNAIGFDVSESQIDEASRRSYDAGFATYAFEQCSASLDELDDVPDGCADVATSMFSLNYFFGSEESALGVFRRAARILRLGGRFVGVYAEGDKVADLVRVGPKTTSAYEIEASWDELSDASPGIGDGYKLLVRDTVMDGTSVGGGAPVEYVTRAADVCRMAKAVGLRPIPEGFRMPRSSDVRDPDYRRIASLTRSFAFEKIPVS